jgi:AraC family transcriptional regulator
MRSPIVRYHRLSIPGLTADYTRLAAGNGPSITAAHAIGVVFTPQRHASWLVGGIRRSSSLSASEVLIAPAEALSWQEWTDVSESIEMWIAPRLLNEVSAGVGGPSSVRFDYEEGANDPTIVNVASLVRQALLAGAQDLRALEFLPLFLATHVLERFQGLRFPPLGSIRKLDRARLARVTEYIDAFLQRPIDLVELARIVGHSPHHFAKAFKAATGSGPHSYLVARRMERALALLQQTDRSIQQVAALVGFTSRSHFRSRFRTHWGEPTEVYRRRGRPRRTS